MATPKGDRIISTGNAELDKKLGGGIPVGTLSLIEGETDAGKSVLSQQMLSGSLNNLFTATVLTTENSVKSLVKQMQSLSMDITDHLLLNKLKIYPVKATRSLNGAQAALHGLSQAMFKQEGRDLVIVDSLTSFVAHTNVENVITFFEDCKELCNRGVSIVVTAHTHAFDNGTMIRITSMADAHMRLTTEAMGEKLVKTLEVSKVRGAKLSTGNIVTFDVEPGWGMKIIPFSKAQA